MTIHGSAEARQLARRLLERETTGVTEEAALGAAMQHAYGRMSDQLRRCVGEDGFTALLARALSRTQSEWPVLKQLKRVDARRVHLDVASGVDAHGVKVVDEALESLFAAIVDILGDLIGADMVGNLLGDDRPGHTRDNGRSP